MTKMLLYSLELTILISNFFSSNLKTALKALQIENFKKYLMTENTLYYTTTKEFRNMLLHGKFELIQS